jgi:hypothetical protein
VFSPTGALATSCRALRHASLLLRQSDAYYEARVPSQCERDAPPSRDVRLHDAWPLHCGAERREYDVLRPYDDVPQLSSTCGFLQIYFKGSQKHLSGCFRAEGDDLQR